MNRTRSSKIPASVCRWAVGNRKLFMKKRNCRCYLCRRWSGGNVRSVFVSLSVSRITPKFVGGFSWSCLNFWSDLEVNICWIAVIRKWRHSVLLDFSYRTTATLCTSTAVLVKRSVSLLNSRTLACCSSVTIACRFDVVRRRYAPYRWPSSCRPTDGKRLVLNDFVGQWQT